MCTFFFVSHFHEFNFYLHKMLLYECRIYRYYIDIYTIYIGILYTKIIYIIKCIVMRSVEIKCSEKYRITMPLISNLLREYRPRGNCITRWTFSFFFLVFDEAMSINWSICQSIFLSDFSTFEASIKGVLIKWEILRKICFYLKFLDI